MPEAHAKHGPSSLKNKAVCPGWINDPTSDTTRADEGTRLHAAAESGNLAGLDAEQAGAVTKCLNYLAPLEKNAKVVLKEVRLNVCGVTWGTSDRVIVTKDGHLHVPDFKFGFGSVDDAEVNLQGWAYALGAWALYPECPTCTVHFLLPRRDEVSHHTFTRADISRMELAVRTVIARCEEFDRSGDVSMLHATEDNCLYCGRKGTCPKVTSVALATVKKYAPLEIVEEVHSSQITNPAQMAKLVSMVKVIEKFVDSVKHHSLQMALDQGGLYDESGKAIYELAQKSAPREVANLGSAVDVLRSFGLTDAELLTACKLSLPKALSLVGEKAPRGKKSALIGEVETKLSEAGAIAQAEPIRYLKKVKE